MTPGSAPCVQKEDLENAISDETYTVLPDGRTTICQLSLYNGFSVIGKSAPVSALNFDAEMGRQIARENAVSQLWPLLNFRLAESIYRESMKQDAIPPLAAAQATLETMPVVYKAIGLGDQVHFYEQKDGVVAGPLVAMVTASDNDRFVALTVFAPNGSTHARQGVILLGADEDAPLDVQHFARHKE